MSHLCPVPWSSRASTGLAQEPGPSVVEPGERQRARVETHPHAAGPRRSPPHQVSTRPRPGARTARPPNNSSSVEPGPSSVEPGPRWSSRASASEPASRPTPHAAGLDAPSPRGSDGSTNEGFRSVVEPGPATVEPGERQRARVETSTPRRSPPHQVSTRPRPGARTARPPNQPPVESSRAPRRSSRAPSVVEPGERKRARVETRRLTGARSGQQRSMVASLRAWSP